MKQTLRMLAAYNRWANRRVYGAAESLSPEEFGRHVGAFFGSLRGTLNHLLVADRIWMKRFTGTGDAPNRLDVVLHEDLTALAKARVAEDERIAGWIDGLSDAAIEGRFTYVTVTDMRTVSQRLAPAVVHLFNHQTHHRGQAHMILTVLGKPSVSLDMVAFQRTDEGREFA